MTAVPAFRSAFVQTGAGAALPRRRLGRTFVVSIAAHGVAGSGLLVLSLLRLDPIPAPPLTVRFVPMPPPPPRVAPLHEERRPPVPPPPPRPHPDAALPAPAPPPPVPLQPRPRPAPKPIGVEPQEPLRPAAEEPAPRVTDAAPPPARTAPSLGSVAAAPSLPAGTGEEPELVLLTPGRSRPRGPGGGLAGSGEGLANLPAAPGARDGAPGGAGRGGRAGGRGGAGAAAGPGGTAGDGADGTGPAFAATGLASFLAKKYGVPLIEAARLGQRTSDGARYALLLPMLSEAYREIGLRGTWRSAGDDPSGIAEARADGEALAIRYRDGSMDVIVPTHDGLVALFVSAGRAGGARGKVDEAERALAALRRLARVRG
jgi:hypothetical protein